MTPPRLFLISDTHYNHINIIRYCARPFANVDIRRWNDIVAPTDHIIHLGDFVMGQRVPKLDAIASQLHGHGMRYISHILKIRISPTYLRYPHQRSQDTYLSITGYVSLRIRYPNSHTTTAVIFCLPQILTPPTSPMSFSHHMLPTYLPVSHPVTPTSVSKKYYRSKGGCARFIYELCLTSPRCGRYVIVGTRFSPQYQRGGLK